MAGLDKKSLSERDICTKFITPAVKQAGWDELSQIREDVSFTKGRIIVRGKLVTRGKAKRADYILYYKPNIPIALIEAKDNSYPVGGDMQQGLEYVATLDIPFVFSSNGDGFVFHGRTGRSEKREAELSLSAFPTPDALWQKYRAWKGLAPAPRRSSAKMAMSSISPGRGQEASADRYVLRDLPLPLSSDHRAGGQPKAVPGTLPGFL